MANVKLDVMAMAAHPDDAELGCGGTLILQAEKGWKTGIVDLTQGELGTRGTAQTRQEEARAAAKVMGLSVRENLKLPDGFFDNSKESRLRLIRVIRKYRPEIVLANAPEDRHPDHGRAATLIYDSCFLAGLRKIETELDGREQEAWRPKQIFHFIQDRYLDPDFIVDISSVIERKKEAIRSFKTQFMADKADTLQTYISTPAFFDSLIHRCELHGRMIGVPYGEGFISAKKLGVSQLGDLII